MDFHKISESEEVEVFQAMSQGDTAPAPDGSEVRKYSPELPEKVNAATVTKALEPFAGYDVDSITVSTNGGITVRVARGKDNPYEKKEPGVERLVSLKGGKK